MRTPRAGNTCLRGHYEFVAHATVHQTVRCTSSHVEFDLFHHLKMPSSLSMRGTKLAARISSVRAAMSTAGAEKATVARKFPFWSQLEAGKTYYWCSCGKSAKQPFCDGSHKGTSFVPMKFTPEASGRKLMCACKGTKTAPYCDASHVKKWFGSD